MNALDPGHTCSVRAGAEACCQRSLMVTPPRRSHVRSAPTPRVSSLRNAPPGPPRTKCDVLASGEVGLLRAKRDSPRETTLIPAHGWNPRSLERTRPPPRDARHGPQKGPPALEAQLSFPSAPGHSDIAEGASHFIAEEEVHALPGLENRSPAIPDRGFASRPLRRINTSQKTRSPITLQ